VVKKRALTFKSFAMLEKKGDLKKLVGKKPKEDLTDKDAKKLGNMIARMKGKKKQKHVGIINFLGASCDLYNEIWKNYVKTRDSLEK
jgi:hypothetical protein